MIKEWSIYTSRSKEIGLAKQSLGKISFSMPQTINLMQNHMITTMLTHSDTIPSRNCKKIPFHFYGKPNQIKIITQRSVLYSTIQ